MGEASRKVKSGRVEEWKGKVEARRKDEILRRARRCGQARVAPSVNRAGRTKLAQDDQRFELRWQRMQSAKEANKRVGE
jgi:hypothetical protein